MNAERRPLDRGLNMTGMVQHVFHMYDGLVGRLGNIQDENEEEQPIDTGVNVGVQAEPELEDEEVPDVDHGVPCNPEINSEGVAPEEDMADDDIAAMECMPPTPEQILEESARTPLYAGSDLTQLGGTLLMLNCLRTHGASYMLVNEVFSILSNSMLPKVNSLPKNKYHASKVLKQLGLAYDTIHCCPGPNTCILFRGEEYKDLDRCPVCNAERYREVGKSRVPVKVLRHFPLIPRLQRMYSTPLQASYMT